MSNLVFISLMRMRLLDKYLSKEEKEGGKFPINIHDSTASNQSIYI